MRRLIAVAILAAITSAGASAVLSAQAADRPQPTARQAGVYLGGWSAFLAITEHMVAGKMSELNASPRIRVLSDSPKRSNAVRLDDANGWVTWNFRARVGDFTMHWWTDCSFINRKIDCGGPGGGPRWHNRIEP